MNASSRDPIFLGLTRPTMFLGVTQSFFAINGFTSVILFLACNSFLPLLIWFPMMHGIGCVACLYDVRIFDILMVYGKKSTRCKNKRFWGGNSYDLA